MVLVLHIENKNKASWLVVNKEVDKQLDFAMVPAEDNILAELDKLKVNFDSIKGIGLIINDASLTQVKIFTATINTLGWQFDVPVVGEFYVKQTIDKILPKLVKKIEDTKKFKALEVKYKHKADITISKKQAKYKIGK